MGSLQWQREPIHKPVYPRAEQNTGWSGLIVKGFRAVWDVGLCNLHVSLKGLKTKLCKKRQIVTSSSCFQQVQHQESANKNCPGSAKGNADPRTQGVQRQHGWEGSTPSSLTNLSLPSPFPKRHRQAPAQMANKALRWWRVLAFLMQHLRSQKEENNTKRESAASGRDFHLCSTTSCFLGVFLYSFRKRRSLMNTAWHQECSSPKKRISAGEIKGQERDSTTSVGGKFQGLMVPDNSDNFLRRLAWWTWGEQYSLAWFLGGIGHHCLKKTYSQIILPWIR